MVLESKRSCIRGFSLRISAWINVTTNPATEWIVSSAH